MCVKLSIEGITQTSKEKEGTLTRQNGFGLKFCLVLSNMKGGKNMPSSHNRASPGGNAHYQNRLHTHILSGRLLRTISLLTTSQSNYSQGYITKSND